MDSYHAKIDDRVYAVENKVESHLHQLDSFQNSVDIQMDSFSTQMQTLQSLIHELSNSVPEPNVGLIQSSSRELLPEHRITDCLTGSSINLISFEDDEGNYQGSVEEAHLRSK